MKYLKYDGVFFMEKKINSVLSHEKIWGSIMDLQF